jgi:hypothetical protein
MKQRTAVFLVLVLSSVSLFATQPPAAKEKLGTVDFPVSCAPSQQAAFNRAVALLHDFWYDRAEQQFQAIAAADPTCAVAYWGEAMTIWHEIWDRPNAATLQRGLDLVQKGQKIGAKTQRERDYLNALAQFYQNPQKATFEERVAAYSNAMEKLYEKYPQDHEAAAFYALSLLAAAPPRDMTFANQKKALALLNEQFVLVPDHPGVAHYIIHSCDSPQMAAEGLKAAQRYGEIAPSAPHAAHMPGHIFARLGMWQEDIQSNLASVAAAEVSGSYGHELHAMDFLNYAYLQVGEDNKAREIIAQVQSMDPAAGHDMHGYLDMARAGFPATYEIEMRHWKEAAALDPGASKDPENIAITYWARAVGSGHLHDVAAAKKNLEQYDAQVAAVKNSPKAYLAEYMDTGRDEIRAWIAFAEGKPDEAANIMRAVADKQDTYGKGEVEIPAREMLADILLQSNHPQVALAEYERSMTIDPNRFNELYGAARAAQMTNQPTKAAKYYAKLVENCEHANSDRPELARARSEVSGKAIAQGGD